MIEKNIAIEESEVRVQQAQKMSDEGQTENVLRPKSLSDYIGQEEIKKNLDVFLPAARKRKEPMEHVLLHGCPGLGKTTLAFILAREMCVQIRTTSGPAIERPGDLAALLTNLQKNDVLFIDEIHRLRPAVEEILYSAMEDFFIEKAICFYVFLSIFNWLSFLSKFPCFGNNKYW